MTRISPKMCNEETEHEIDPSMLQANSSLKHEGTNQSVASSDCPNENTSGKHDIPHENLHGHLLQPPEGPRSIPEQTCEEHRVQFSKRSSEPPSVQWISPRNYALRIGWSPPVFFEHEFDSEYVI